jgi:hypothetical protein
MNRLTSRLRVTSDPPSASPPVAPPKCTMPSTCGATTARGTSCRPSPTRSSSRWAWRCQQRSARGTRTREAPVHGRGLRACLARSLQVAGRTSCGLAHWGACCCSCCEPVAKPWPWPLETPVLPHVHMRTHLPGGIHSGLAGNRQDAVQPDRQQPGRPPSGGPHWPAAGSCTAPAQRREGGCGGRVRDGLHVCAFARACRVCSSPLSRSTPIPSTL